MNYWIDLEDSNGVKQGFGPIASAQAWTHTAALDRAGTFSFTMPADDPRRNNLAVKRIARCWTVDNGALKHLGAGIINDISLRVDAEGLPVVTVSGDDLLHVNQVGAAAAIPVLRLEQADVGEDMIEFTATVGTGNAIEAVGAKSLTTTHFIKVTITGVGTVYIPVGTIA